SSVLIVLRSGPGTGWLAHDPAIVGQPPGDSGAVQLFEQRDRYPSCRVQRLPGFRGGERLGQPGQNPGRLVGGPGRPGPVAGPPARSAAAAARLSRPSSLSRSASGARNGASARSASIAWTASATGPGRRCSEPPLPAWPGPGGAPA